MLCTWGCNRLVMFVKIYLKINGYTLSMKSLKLTPSFIDRFRKLAVICLPSVQVQNRQFVFSVTVSWFDVPNKVTGNETRKYTTPCFIFRRTKELAAINEMKSAFGRQGSFERCYSVKTDCVWWFCDLKKERFCLIGCLLCVADMCGLESP